jgi:outer membrane protein assembly factor BamB
MLRASVAAAALALAGCGGVVSAGPGDFGWLAGGTDAEDVSGGTLRVRWRTTLTEPLGSSYVPVERAVAALDPARGRIYVGSVGGALWALTAGGGRVWRYDARAAIECQPALDPRENELYFGTESGVIHALRASDGQLRWRARVNGPVRRVPVLAADAVYVITEMDAVVALSRESGEQLWAYRREPPDGFTITGHAGLIATEGRLITGFSDGTVVALDPASGDLIWERETALDLDDVVEGTPRFVDVDTTPVVHGDSIYVASFAAGLYEIDASSGSVRWHDPERTGIIALAASADALVIASADTGLTALDLEERSVLWRRRMQRGAPGDPRISGGTVLVGESQGAFVALSMANGNELGRVEAGDGFSATAAIHGELGFVVSNGGSLFAFVL